MYPVPRMACEIENEWADELGRRFGRSAAEVKAEVRPWFDFPPVTVRIELMDTSFVEFRRAFYLISETKRAVAVFTEHCGNYVFPYHEAKIFEDGDLVYVHQIA